MRKAMLFIAALAGMLAFAAAPAVQPDPFDTARYYIGIKNSDEALALIDSGQFDINMQTEEGYTLLHYAAEAGDLALIKAMLERGADPNIKSQIGYTPYQMAYSTMVKAELRKAMAAGPVSPAPPGVLPGEGAATAGGTGMCAMVRADPANDGRSPEARPYLSARDAIWYNHPDELAGLIDDCVEVNRQDDYGWTLLHHAAQRDRVALAKLLLDRGASRSLRNQDGETAANLATSAEMKALLGPAAAPKPAPGGEGEAGDRTECEQKYRADAALCSDGTCRMSAMRKWQQCLKTGRYW